MKRGLARRPCRRHTARPRWKRATESVLNALTQLLLLRELVPSISHRPASLHDPLLETSKRPADAALRNAEAVHRGIVGRVLLRVAHNFEGDGPRPRDGDEGETAQAEDDLRLHDLVLRRDVEDRVVCASLLAATYKTGKVRLKKKVSQRIVTHSWAQESAELAWSFIQSALRQNLRAVSAMQVRRRCSASG